MTRTLGFWAVGSTLVLGACAGVSIGEQVDLCEQTVQETGVALLVGSEGSTALCQCTVDSLASRFPDAGERWQLYATELQDRIERRGVLGLAADTLYLQTRGQEMAEFVEVQMGVLSYCGQQLMEAYQLPDGP